MSTANSSRYGIVIDLNLEDPRPRLARDEKAVPGLIVRKAVENFFPCRSEGPALLCAKET